jgi:4-hydroxybenzoate polyprenyltransferase
LAASAAAAWIKNTFVWAGFRLPAWHDVALAQQVALAFIAFCLLASAVYIGNDWFDRDADRAHPTKRDRPLASGRIGGAAAASLAIVLAVAGLALGAWVGAALFAVLVAYLVLNVMYSLLLKRIVIVDVFALSFGFLLRLAGTVGVGIAPSRGF